MLSNEILHLPIGSVTPNPYQPRRIFDTCALDELAESIRVYGVLQPISVRSINGVNYELIAGERRLRASRMAGMATIPAILVDVGDLDSAVLAILENLQRQNLHYLEEAEGFQNLIGEYAFTQEALAQRIGKKQSTIANKLRLLRLPRAVQKQLIEHELTERHARALLRLETEAEQLAVISKIASEHLTVSKSEELIEETVRKPAEKKKPIPFKAYIRDIRILTNSIQENLEIVRRAGLGATFDMQQTDTGYDINIKINYATMRSKVV
ncbi:MAG: ParB/RepB/Spo0J family partition protein [Defluviitaleaceae bacterium]|nr:ParB/RepB/Spo0J family partition protein [Defluviitaleaceae bacterium]